MVYNLLTKIPPFVSDSPLVATLQSRNESHEVSPPKLHPTLVQLLCHSVIPLQMNTWASDTFYQVLPKIPSLVEDWILVLGRNRQWLQDLLCRCETSEADANLVTTNRIQSLQCWLMLLLSLPLKGTSCSRCVAGV